MNDNPLDQTYLVPLPARVIEAILGDNQGELRDYRIEATDDSILVFDGDMLVLESLQSLDAGMVVRVAPMMGDAFELASFVECRKQADTLIACEIAAGAIEDAVIVHLHGMAAGRSKGKWRAFDAGHREIWSRHAVGVNIAKQRAIAASRKLAA